MSHQASRTVFRALVALAFVASAALVSPAARADAAPEEPRARPISLDQALASFRARGFDLLVADAAVRGAEADLRAAGAVANPQVSASVSRLVGQAAAPPPDAPAGWSATGFAIGVSDSAALFDVIAGKRGLRRDVGEAALRVARMGRADAERVLAAAVKEAYLALAVRQDALAYAREGQAFFSKTLELNRLRYPKVIDEGQLARIEVAKLAADQAVDAAVADVRAAQANLAFLVGERGEAPAFVADAAVLAFRVPDELDGATVASLLAEAAERRPDVRAALYAEEGAEATTTLARRRRVPDVAIGAQYAQLGTGTGAVSPPTVTFGVSVPLAIFYQEQGQIARAEADRAALHAARERLTAAVASDVSTAFSAFRTARRRVERMESSGLERARRARDITEVQFAAGATTLIDLLDAQRSFIEVRREYLDALGDYWTSVYELEKAVGGAF